MFRSVTYYQCYLVCNLWNQAGVLTIMKKLLTHLLLGSTVLAGFTACEKKIDSEVEKGNLVIEDGSQADVTVEGLKEDLKEVAATAEIEAQEMVESAKKATAENLETAKDKLTELKVNAAEMVEVADEQLNEAEGVLKAVKEDAVESFNSLLKSDQE